MSQLVMVELDEPALNRLRERAARNGRSVEAGAKTILTGALAPLPASDWAGVNVQREQLAASGWAFSDSTDLIREDRDR